MDIPCEQQTQPLLSVSVHFYKQIFNPDPANFSSKIPPGCVPFSSLITNVMALPPKPPLRLVVAWWLIVEFCAYFGGLAPHEEPTSQPHFTNSLHTVGTPSPPSRASSPQSSSGCTCRCIIPKCLFFICANGHSFHTSKKLGRIEDFVIEIKTNISARAHPSHVKNQHPETFCCCV
jgi:hypothetical protein